METVVVIQIVQLGQYVTKSAITGFTRINRPILVFRILSTYYVRINWKKRRSVSVVWWDEIERRQKNINKYNCFIARVNVMKP